MIIIMITVFFAFLNTYCYMQGILPDSMNIKNYIKYNPCPQATIPKIIYLPFIDLFAC